MVRFTLIAMSMQSTNEPESGSAELIPGLDPTAESDPLDMSCSVDTDELPLKWTYWMAKQAPRRLPGVVIIVAFAVVSIRILYSSLAPAVLAALLLVGSVSEYLFPTRYRLTARAVFADSLIRRHRIRWGDVRRVERIQNGLLLSPTEQPSRFDSFRGVAVRFAPRGEPGDRASVIEFVRRHATSARYALPEERPSDGR